MKVLIVRMYPSIVKIKNYNLQEIGLAKALIKKGHQCDIVYYNGNNESKKETINFDNCAINIFWIKGKNIAKNCFYDKELYNIIKDYDVVQTSEFNQVSNIKLMRKCKNLVIYHGPYYSEYNKLFNLKCTLTKIYYKIFARKYFKQRFIAKSNLAKEYLLKMGFKNVETIGVGLDDEKFKKVTIDYGNKNNNQTQLLYIGQIEDRRNIFFMLDVLKKVNKSKDVKLTLIGKGNKEYVEKCLNYANEIGITNKLEYIETVTQDEIYKYYSKADLFMLPTKYEIFGMVILESLYFGVPVITTLNGGSSTLIENEKNGFICELDTNIWTNKIVDYINGKYKINNKEISASLKNNYTWDAIANRFIDVYSNGGERNEK